MKKILVFIVSLISLIACSQSPIVTFEIITPAVTPTFTPWVAGTQTALADNTGPTSMEATLVPLPTFDFAQATPTDPASIPQVDPTQVITEKPTDFSPVLYGKKYDANTFFLLLGGASRDAWLTPDESVARFSSEVTYAIHTFNIANQYFFWGKAPEQQHTCNAYLIGTDIDLNEPGMVATLDGWGVAKNPVTELANHGLLYQQVVTDWLIAQGLLNPQIAVIRVYRVDLEGDGTDEVLISATHLDGSQHTTQAGDYSIILMRKVIGNDTVTIPLAADFYISKELEITYPRTYSIGNIVDLNQDGVMEVVVDIQKWEGFGAIVYQVNGQDVTEALRAEC